MTTIKIFRALVLSALLLAVLSCTREPLEKSSTQPPVVPEGKVRLELITNADDFQKPVETRTGQADESTVGTAPWVFVFKKDGDGKFVEAVQAVYSDNKSLVTLTAATDARTLLILANAPAEFWNGTANTTFNQTNVAAWLDGKTAADAQKMLTTPLASTNQATIPYTPNLLLPMSEKVELLKIDATSVINNTGTAGGTVLQLKRIVAKVTVQNNVNSGFILQGATVAGASRQGFLFPAGPVSSADGGATPLTTNYLTATTGDGVTGIASGVSGNSSTVAPDGTGYQNTSTNPIYIYESAAGETSVIVKGTYNNTEGYYRLAFKGKGNSGITDGTIMAIQRNCHYKFTIEKVSVAGYASAAEAITAPPSNIIYDIAVTDLSSHEIIDNGQYYLGVSNSEVIVYDIPGNDTPVANTIIAVTVTTDATAAMGLTTNSITVSGTGLTGASPNVLTLGGSTTISVTMGTTFISTVKNGLITIKLGNLTKTIAVSRRPALIFPGLATEIPGTFVAGKIVDAQGDATEKWLSLSLDGTTPSTNDYITPTAAGSLYVMKPRDYTANRTNGVIYLTNQNGNTTTKVIVNEMQYYPAFASVIGYDGDGVLNLDGRGVMAYFKFGSVVAFNAPWTPFPATSEWKWGNSKIVFNTTTEFESYYHTTNSTNNYGYNLIPYANSTTFPAQTSDNILTGRGDPCRLVGLTMDQIKSGMVDNGRWRLPTAAGYTFENFNAASTSFIYPPSADRTPTSAGNVLSYDRVADSKYTYLGVIKLTGAAATTFGSTLTLATGGNFTSGYLSSQGYSGAYWSSTPYNDRGFALGFGDYLDPSANFKIYQTNGYSVRCISQ